LNFESAHNTVAAPYGEDQNDGYYNVMTSSEQQQQHHSPVPGAGESYRSGVVSGSAPSDMSTAVTTVDPSAMDDDPNDRELNLTLPAPTTLIQ